MLVTHHKVSAIVQRWMKDYTVGKENELYTESVSLATFRDEVSCLQIFCVASYHKKMNLFMDTLFFLFFFLTFFFFFNFFFNI